MMSMAPTGPRPDVLIVAAHAPELAGLRTALTERLDAHVRNLRVVGKTIGIGMPAAGAGMTNRLSQLAPRCVVLLGTCGVYPGLQQYRPNDVVVATRLVLLDHSVVAGRAAFPDPMQIAIDPHPLMATALASAGPRSKAAPVATTLSVTTADDVAARVHGATGCEAENLEGFAVGVACAAAQVPYACVLGVSNVVGSSGREDWKSYQRSAVVAAAEVIVAWLQQGAPGLPHG